MTQGRIHREVQIVAGDGIVAHLGGLMAFARGESGQLNQLRNRFESFSDMPWQQTVRTITTGISSSGFDDHPAVACLCVESKKVSAFVFGAVELTLVIDGETSILDGRDSSTWIDVVVRGSVDQVRVGITDRAPLVGVLRDGVVPAGGFVFQASQPEPPTEAFDDADVADQSSAVTRDEDEDTAATSDTTVAEMFALLSQLDPTESAEFLDELPERPTSPSLEEQSEPLSRWSSHQSETFANSDAPAGASPFDQLEAQIAAKQAGTAVLTKSRPMLSGVHCPNGHFTSPKSDNCRTCGVTVAPRAELSLQARPVLGHLFFDDGAVLSIDRPAAIGSDVPSGYVIDGEPTTTVRLDDGHGGVADIQMEVRPAGWNVEIMDMDSDNGTYTMLVGQRHTRTRLRSGQLVTLQDGMTVEAGTRTFTFKLEPESDS